MEFTGQPVDDINLVPEPLRTLYVKNDDNKYVVSDSNKNISDALVGLNTALKKAREDAKRGKVDLTPLSTYGTTPEEIAAGVETTIKSLEEQIAAKGGDTKTAVEKARQEMAQSHSDEKKKYDARITALQGQLYTHLVESAATAAVAEANGVPELLLPFIKNNVRVTEDNGQYVVQVVDAAGEIRYNNVTGAAMNIKDLVAEMKSQEKYGRLFNSETPNGGGFRPGAGTRQPPKGSENMSATDKIMAGLQGMRRN